jgi:hypothetical protein
VKLYFEYRDPLTMPVRSASGFCNIGVHLFMFKH